MLSVKGEQFIELMHTQNRKPNWNIQFDYRFISAPGLVQQPKPAIIIICYQLVSISQ